MNTTQERLKEILETPIDQGNPYSFSNALYTNALSMSQKRFDVFKRLLSELEALANEPAQDVNAELLDVCRKLYDFIPDCENGEMGETCLRARRVIARAEAAQTPKTHEGHNASRAVREAAE